MTILGVLSVVGKADMRNFDKGVKQSAKLTKTFTSTLGGLASAVTAFAGVAATGLGLVREFSEGNVEQQRFADRLGITTQMLRGYQKAARSVGAETEQMNDALLELSKRSSEATTGTGSLFDALQILNIDVEKFNRLTLDKQFDLVAKSLNGLGKAQQNFLSDEIFGGAADNISGLETQINNLAKSYGNLGTASGDERARKFVSQWKEITDTFASVKRDFLIDITPAALDALGIIKDVLPFLGAAAEANKIIATRLFGGTGSEGLGPIDRSTLSSGPPLPPAVAAERRESIRMEAENNARAQALLESIAESGNATAVALTNPLDFL